MSNRRKRNDYLSAAEEQRLKRIRIKWMITQKNKRLNEKKKRMMIEAYERKRAKMLELKKKQKFRENRRPRRSRSRSRSKDSQHKSRLNEYTNGSKSSKTGGIWDRLDTPKVNKPCFVDLENDVEKLDPNELELIEVKIFQKTPSASNSNEIRRDIINSEDIRLSRREGEGKKPIFDREELKQTDRKLIEVEKHRAVEPVEKSNSAKKNCTKRYSASLSPRRRRSPSPHVHPSSQKSNTDRSRYDVQEKSRNGDHLKDREKARYRSRSRDKIKENRRRRDSPQTSRKRSLSRDRNRLKSDRNYSRSRKYENDYKNKEYRETKKYRVTKECQKSYSERKRRDSSYDSRLTRRR